jgi:hypothetical protein
MCTWIQRRTFLVEIADSDPAFWLLKDTSSVTNIQEMHKCIIHVHVYCTQETQTQAFWLLKDTSSVTNIQEMHTCIIQVPSFQVFTQHPLTDERQNVTVHYSCACILHTGDSDSGILAVQGYIICWKFARNTYIQYSCACILHTGDSDSDILADQGKFICTNIQGIHTCFIHVYVCCTQHSQTHHACIYVCIHVYMYVFTCM